jgi:hypothetical protein
MGGESLAGENDAIRTDGGGYWQIQMSGIELVGPDLVRAWRAWEAELEGGVTRVLVPIADIRHAPRSAIGKVLAKPSDLAAESVDPYFPEALGFATPFIIAETVGAALLRATQLVIDVTRGARLKGGEHFAINHATSGRRIYRVHRVLSRDGQQATVSIRPPLREAIADGTALDFDWPSVVAVVMPENDISADIGNGHASVNIAFREAL